jgi:hypothetical protein
VQRMGLGQRGVRTAEVVVHEVNVHRIRVVLDLAREGIC